MLKYKSLISICFIALIITGCKKIDNNISFEQIQNFFYEEIEKEKPVGIEPFYIDEPFFKEIEKQLNEDISQSDYYSIMITVNVNTGKLEVSLLYNLGKNVYYNSWNWYNQNTKSIVKKTDAKRILKKKPAEMICFDNIDNSTFDRTSTYIIKKTGANTYYYANYNISENADYQSLIDLFREVKTD